MDKRQRQRKIALRGQNLRCVSGGRIVRTKHSPIAGINPAPSYLTDFERQVWAALEVIALAEETDTEPRDLIQTYRCIRDYHADKPRPSTSWLMLVMCVLFVFLSVTVLHSRGRCATHRLRRRSRNDLGAYIDLSPATIGHSRSSDSHAYLLPAHVHLDLAS